MDLRKIAINLIALALFSFYFGTITQKFLKYETITDVELIKKHSDIPKIDSYFAVAISKIFKGKGVWSAMQRVPASNESFWLERTLNKDEIFDSFTINQKSINMSNKSFLFKGFKFWKVQYNLSSDVIKDELFEIGTKIDLTNGMLVNKLFSGRNNKELANTLLPLQKYPGVQNVAVMYILNFLPSPYDTHCRTYNVSQYACLTWCTKEKKIGKKPEQLDVKRQENVAWCYNHCSQKDCSAILFSALQTANRSRKNLWTILFALMQTLTLDSVAVFSLFLYVQQTFGLIAIFLEFMVLDLVSPALQFAKWLTKDKDQLFYRRNEDVDTKWKKLQVVLSVLIICGCFIHFVVVMTHYFEYRTSSETFLGKPPFQQAPVVGVCYNHNSSSSMTFAEINSSTPQLHELFNVEFPYSNASSMQPITVFKSRKKCFVIAPASGFEDTLSEIILEISTSLAIPFEATFGLDVMIPRRPPQFRLTRRLTSHESVIFAYKLLQAPFSSRCFNFNTVGFDSRLHCIEDCIVQQFVKKYKTFPVGYTCTNHFNLSTANVSVDKMLIFSCQMQCNRQECLSRKLEIRRVVKIESGKQLRFQLLRQKYLTSTSMIPEQSVTEFITFVANLFSLWIGSCRVLTIKFIHKFKIKHVKYFKSILFLIFILGFVTHISMLLSNYFLYEMVTSVSSGLPAIVSLPSVTFVFRLNERTSRNGGTMNNCSTVSNQSPPDVDNLFLKNHKMFEYIELVNPITFIDNYNVTDEIIENFTSSYVYSCMKVVTLELGRFRSDFFKYNWFQIKSRRNFLLRIDLKGELKVDYEVKENISLKNSSIYTAVLHSRDYYDIKGYEVSYMYKTAYLNSRILKTKLLPHPFSTKCINYINPLKTKNSWFNCIKRKHLKRFGSIPNTLTLPSHYNFNRSDPDNELYEKCIKKHQQIPCKSLRYETTQASRSRVAGDIQVIPSNEETKCEFVPRMSLLGLTIYLAEILDIWLGVNMYFLLKKLGSIPCHRSNQ